MDWASIDRLHNGAKYFLKKYLNFQKKNNAKVFSLKDNYESFDNNNVKIEEISCENISGFYEIWNTPSKIISLHCAIGDAKENQSVSSSQLIFEHPNIFPLPPT